MNKDARRLKQILVIIIFFPYLLLLLEFMSNLSSVNVIYFGIALIVIFCIDLVIYTIYYRITRGHANWIKVFFVKKMDQHKLRKGGKYVYEKEWILYEFLIGGAILVAIVGIGMLFMFLARAPFDYNAYAFVLILGGGGLLFIIFALTLPIAYECKRDVVEENKVAGLGN